MVTHAGHCFFHLWCVLTSEAKCAQRNRRTIVAVRCTWILVGCYQLKFHATTCLNESATCVISCLQVHVAVDSILNTKRNLRNITPGITVQHRLNRAIGALALPWNASCPNGTAMHSVARAAWCSFLCTQDHRIFLPPSHININLKQSVENLTKSSHFIYFPYPCTDTRLLKSLNRAVGTFLY